MKADINFNDGTIILVCSKCRRKHLKRIEDTKTALSITCQCKNVVSWEGDLTWVQCYAQPYGITTRLAAQDSASDRLGFAIK